MKTSKMFQYEGHPVTFIPGIDKSVMTNATQMAKPFGKRPVDWLRLPATTEFINSLLKAKYSQTSEYQQYLSKCENLTSLNINELQELFPALIKTVKGGTIGSVEQGTWFNRDITMEFARWLNPMFAIWCNDRIIELMQFGFTATDNFLDDLMNNPDKTIEMIVDISTKLVDIRKRNAELVNENQQLIDSIEETEREAERRMQIINKQMETIGLQAPKAEYHDKVLESKSLIRSTVIAKEVGMSATNMLKKLKGLGVIWKVGGVWVPTAKYQGKGIAGTTTFVYSDTSGVERTSISIAWTEAGRKLIHELLDPKLNKPA